MKLRLYISGSGQRATKAIAQAQRVCQLVPDSELEVIDITESPQAAEDNHVLTTPTLMRLDPLPERRVVGDMKDPVEVAAYLLSSRG